MIVVTPTLGVLSDTPTLTIAISTVTDRLKNISAFHELIGTDRH